MAAPVAKIVDLVEEEEEEEATTDPVVATYGQPDLRFCPKCKTYSYVRKGGCANRGCEAFFYSKIFLVNTLGCIYQEFF